MSSRLCHDLCLNALIVLKAQANVRLQARSAAMPKTSRFRIWCQDVAPLLPGHHDRPYAYMICLQSFAGQHWRYEIGLA